MNPVILIVEDEADLVELLRYNLEREGYEVLATPSGEEALLIVDERQIDLMLLDWMLPHMSGIEVCRQLRRKPESRNLPVIMLTARGEQADRVRGLDTGADDYVTKPFAPEELIARIHAVMRRARPALSEERLTYGDIEMNLTEHKVARNARPVILGPTEFRLAASLHGTSGSGVFPRSADRFRVGPRHLYRFPHRGRSYPSFAQSPERQGRAGMLSAPCGPPAMPSTRRPQSPDPMEMGRDDRQVR